MEKKLSYDELKAHFDLRKCTNKEHLFQIGKLLGSWQIANDNWSMVCTNNQSLRTEVLAFTISKTADGLKYYSISAFKLKIVWGFT